MPPVKINAVVMPKPDMMSAPPADAPDAGGDVSRMVIEATDNGGFSVESFNKPSPGDDHGSALASFRPTKHAFGSTDELVDFIKSSFPAASDADTPPAPDDAGAAPDAGAAENG